MTPGPTSSLFSPIFKQKLLWLSLLGIVLLALSYSFLGYLPLRISSDDWVYTVLVRGGVSLQLAEMPGAAERPSYPEPRWESLARNHSTYPYLKQVWGGQPARPGSQQSSYRWLGFEFAEFTPDGNPEKRIRAIALPLWLLSIPWALTIVQTVKVLRRIRSPSQCSQCGYDIRMSKERCPECGCDLSDIRER
jgi:hypothetical protein